MGEPAAKKPRGSEGHVPTMREFLPWHVIEKKLEERESEPEAEPERKPDSGVYASGQHVIAANENEEPAGESGALTYRVYTVADLEAHGFNADLSVSSTRGSMVLSAPKPNPWADVARAAINVARTAKTWLIGPGPRPPVGLVLRAPMVAFGYELRQALKTVEWKKVAIYGGVSVGVFLVLLFAVVTVADATDDLKPSRMPTMQSGDSYTSAIVASAQPKAATKAAAAPSAAKPDVGDGLEVSEESAAPAAPVKATPKKKASAKKKGKSGEVFIP
jgi:hypothetical protein